MLPPRDDTFLLIALGTAAMAVVFAWQVGYGTGFKSALTEGKVQIQALQTQAQVEETDSIVGKIISITDTTIELQMFIPRQSNESITINSETIFERLVPKDQEAFQSEIVAFNVKVQATQTQGTQLPPEDFPIPVAFIKISLDDLRPGNIIQATIESAQTENQLVAKRVVVQPAPPIGENAPAALSQ